MAALRACKANFCLGMMSSKLAVNFSSLHFTFYLDLSITIIYTLRAMIQ